MDYIEIKNWLKENLSKDRYIHSISVAEFSKKIAKIHGYDSDKAYLAGLLHDCARDFKVEELKNYAISCKIKIDEVEQFHPILLHAPVSACIAKEKFGVTDNEILQAIASHTVLNKSPKILDKILYVADLAEPKREFPEAKPIRDEALRDLDKAVILAIDLTFFYLINEKRLIHPVTLSARNLLIREVYYGKN